MVAPLRQELRPQLERMREATRSTAAKATDLLALAEGVQAGPLRLLGEVEGLLGVVLAIKVSPPEYRRIVGTLSSFLQDAWGANDWLVRQAADDVAEIVDRGRAGGLSADKVQALARARVEQLQAGLGELGTAFADGPTSPVRLRRLRQPGQGDRRGRGARDFGQPRDQPPQRCRDGL